jgi:hypothetical protein
VLTYVRSAWGNNAAPVATAEVTAVKSGKPLLAAAGGMRAKPH